MMAFLLGWEIEWRCSDGMPGYWPDRDDPAAFPARAFDAGKKEW
ncbi:hypothetical protein PVT71_26010 (plasmid) [Salipiger sp. H15]|uniref:Uncharacterized protein n=1 Tax=Alloyangia sp. H15 TaxID=3029062 RepID=A0AAU8ART3_9RHOB